MPSVPNKIDLECLRRGPDLPMSKK